MLIFHIIAAIAGLIFALFDMLQPSRRLFGAVGISTGVVVLSGVILAFEGRSLGHLCVSGLVYLIVVVSIRLRAKKAIKLMAVKDR